MTFRDARALGYSIFVERRYICGEAGWWYDVVLRGRIVAQGWTVGFGPRAKSAAMSDALAAVSDREALAGLRKGA